MKSNKKRLAQIVAWAELEKKTILSDDRFHYKPALVHINAPLALIQVDLKARYAVLLRVLNFAKENTGEG